MLTRMTSINGVIHPSLKINTQASTVFSFIGNYHFIVVNFKMKSFFYKKKLYPVIILGVFSLINKIKQS
jgi:hypothetical protein